MIKKFLSEKETLFRNEALYLSELEAFQEAPRLYFALPSDDGGFYLGLEYRQGRSLLEIASSLSLDERLVLATLLQNSLARLHESFRTTHGDISPKNILVEPMTNGYQIAFLDWEYASKIDREDIKDYTAFKGTFGFQGVEETGEVSRVEKDRLALSRCFEQLEIPLDLLAKREKGNRFNFGLSRWNKRT